MASPGYAADILTLFLFARQFVQESDIYHTHYQGRIKRWASQVAAWDANL
jgi:hypothetical protein